MALTRKKKVKTVARVAGLSWQPLKKGDLVDVIAPGFRPTDDEVEAGIQFLESWGLRARLPKDIFAGPSEQPDVLSANSDAKRLAAFQRALVARDSRAVWCLRGGYGAIRLVPGLLKVKRPSVVKPLLGLSDVTTLQLFLLEKWKWPSLHSALLDRLGRVVNPRLAKGPNGPRPIPPEAHVEELQRVLFGEVNSVLFEGLRWIGHEPGAKPKVRSIKGMLTGGNLVTFSSAIGTSIHPSTKGRIVFFEDIGERGYRVDRLLEQMVQSGVLSSKTKAIIFGEFTEGHEPDGTNKVSAVIERFASTWAKKNGVAVLTGLPIGHGEHQRVVPIGTQADLDWKAGALTVQVGSR